MENNFKNGDLIIPNDRIEDAFTYRVGMELDENFNYRVATSSESIYYRKYVKSGLVEIRSVNEYIKNKQQYAGDVGKERSEEVQGYIDKMNAAMQMFKY